MARTTASCITLRFRLWLVAAAVACVPKAASACPVCPTETGREVRAEIFDGRFAENVVLTLLPFPLLMGIVAAIHFGVRLSIPFRMKND